jgi:hypothetical protein
VPAPPPGKLLHLKLSGKSQGRFPHVPAAQGGGLVAHFPDQLARFRNRPALSGSRPDAAPAADGRRAGPRSAPALPRSGEAIEPGAAAAGAAALAEDPLRAGGQARIAVAGNPAPRELPLALRQRAGGLARNARRETPYAYRTTPTEEIKVLRLGGPSCGSEWSKSALTPAGGQTPRRTVHTPCGEAAGRESPPSPCSPISWLAAGAFALAAWAAGPASSGIPGTAGRRGAGSPRDHSPGR